METHNIEEILQFLYSIFRVLGNESEKMERDN